MYFVMFKKLINFIVKISKTFFIYELYNFLKKCQQFQVV